MKNNMLKYLSAVLCIMISFTSCDDIVTYNDDYDDGSKSDGPPVISKISPVGDPDGEIVTGSFNQMLIIHGQNLSNVKSIRFNDQEVDLKEIYAVSSQIVVAVPGTVPNEITNMVTVTTEKGEVSYEFKIEFPDIVIDGFSFEFANAGDIIDIKGENLLLYNLTPENGIITVNGASAQILNCTEVAVTIVLPEGTTDNSEIVITSDRIESVIGETLEITYRDNGIRIVDWGSGYLTHPQINGATDGSSPGDPTPLVAGTNFSRLTGTAATWSWNNIINGYSFNMPFSDPLVADIIANQDNYDLAYELLVKENKPIIAGQRMLLQFAGVRVVDVEWIPAASGVPYETGGEWVSRRIDLTPYKTGGNSPLKETGNILLFSFINGTGTLFEMDISVTNFRIVKKAYVRKQQQ